MSAYGETCCLAKGFRAVYRQNIDRFYQARCEYLIPNWQEHISACCARYQVQSTPEFNDTENEKLSNTLHENPFDIEKVKKHQLHLTLGFHRLSYLLRMKTNFLHHRRQYTDGNHLPFHKQIKLEVAYQEFEEAFYKKQGKTIPVRTLKITINGSIEVLANAFKAMMVHPGYNGAPFLQVNQKEAMTFLWDHTVKNNGEPIDESILRSIFVDEEMTTTTKAFKSPLSHIQSNQYYEYDIDSLVNTLQSISDIDFRLLFLMRVKTNYLQHRPTNDQERSFEIRINREIAHQKKLRKLQLRKSALIPIEEPRIRINGQINIFIQVFYELLMEFKGTNGLPYLSVSKKKLVRFICKYFVDKNGGNLSPNTLYILLKPTSGWKRCPEHKRIHLDTFKDK